MSYRFFIVQLRHHFYLNIWYWIFLLQLKGITLLSCSSCLLCLFFNLELNSRYGFLNNVFVLDFNCYNLSGPGGKKLRIPHSSSFLCFNSDLNIFYYTVIFISFILSSLVVWFGTSAPTLCCLKSSIKQI